MFCSNCGFQVADNVAVCNNCGRPAGMGAAAGPARTDEKAVISLVLGVLSVTVLSLLAGIPAVILGHISRANIRKSFGQLKGEGMALAGLIMGYISIALIPVIFIIAAIAIPALVRARETTQESKAVSSLHTIQTAESAYRTFASGKYGGIPDLIDRGMLSSEFRNRVSGYEFTIVEDDREFTATATPATSNEGRYAYTMMSDGIVHYSRDSKLAPDGKAGQEVR